MKQQIKEENYRFAEDIGKSEGDRIALEITKLSAEIKTVGKSKSRISWYDEKFDG